MNILRRWLLRRELRRTPHKELAEQHELLVRLARRCAYDLRHAADDVPRGNWMDWHQRAQHWVDLFQAGNAMKDYRHEIHRKLGALEGRVEEYQRLLAKHGIDDPYGGDIPF